MKVLLMYDYPSPPTGLSTQGDLLYRGLMETGVDIFPVNYRSNSEKEWYYRWFKPDIAVGIGFWGYSPEIIQHPLKAGITPVPWLVADGYIANFQDLLNSLPLILVTSRWVKDVYIRDGIKGDSIEVLPVGCDVNQFKPRSMSEPQVAAVREVLGVQSDQILILTSGGDAASKGGREVLQALGQITQEVPDWRYVCKVWPQERTYVQNRLDLDLARELGLTDRFKIVTDTISRNFMPYLLNACDIYAAPSRIEGFGMLQVEAGASGKPVIGLNAMGMLDTLVHEKTALLAGVAVENRITETMLGPEAGYKAGYRYIFERPRVVDYRASVEDIAHHLVTLMNDPNLRQTMGESARTHVSEHFDYRKVARQFVELVHTHLGIS